MRVRLAYGEGWPRRRPSRRPFDRDHPLASAAGADPTAEVLRALRHPVAGKPLRELVHRGQTVAICICDGTRAQPRALMIPAVLDELDGIVGPTTSSCSSRPAPTAATPTTELRAMLGDEVVDRVRVVNHDARDDASLAWVGASRRRRAGLAQPRVGRGRRADHDRLRRAALLRRLLRRPEDGRARPGRARDRADAARRRPDRPPDARPGASPRATRSTTTSARSRPAPASTSPST